jgi:hypothetical protein
VYVGPEKFLLSGAYLRGPNVSSLLYEQLREEKTALKRELRRVDDEFCARVRICFILEIFISI